MATTPASSNSFLLSASKLASDEPLPSGISVSRASVSTNFLVTVRYSSDDSPALLMIHFDPARYNTWYPPFAFIPWNTERSLTTFSEIYQSLVSCCPTQACPPEAKQSAEASVKSSLQLTRLESRVAEWIPSELWLKFSKSQRQWTAYRFDYCLVSDCDLAGLKRRMELHDCAALPLVGSPYSAACASGEYRNIPIVDNLLRLLRNGVVVSTLCESALTLTS